MPLFFLFFLLAVTTVLAIKPTPSFAQDKYEKKTYMFIPWGDGKGQLPVYQQQQGRHWLRLGPSAFVLGDDGSVYLTCMNDQQRQLIKGFDSRGNELGEYDPRLKPHSGIDKLYFENGKIIFYNAHDSSNEIVELNKNLSIYKKIKIPKGEFSVDSSAELENGMVCHPFPIKNEKRIYVFDESAWRAKGSPRYPIRSKHQFRLGVSFKDSRMGEVGVEKNKDESGWSRKTPVSGTVTLFKNESKVSDYWQEKKEDYFWKDTDRYGNVYSAFDFFGTNLNPFLIKVSADGALLFQALLPKMKFLSAYHFGTGRVPVQIDPDGDIFYLNDSPEGLYVDEWAEKKE